MNNNWLTCSIVDFFSSITIHSVQYLGWVSAVVAAILALTTIIFSQYNERSIQRSTDLSWNIRGKSKKLNQEDIGEEITFSFNTMVNLLSSNQVYLKTIDIFTKTSYFLILLWVISFLGYWKNGNDSSNSDFFIIFLSTILLAIPFISLPKILKKFNSNHPVLVKDCNCTIQDAFLYFDELAVEKSSLIIKLLQPKVQITLNSKGYLEVEYFQSLFLNDFSVSLRFVSKDNKKVTYIHFVIDKFNNRLKYGIKSIEDPGFQEDFSGLFKLLEKLTDSCKLYIVDNENKYPLVFETKKTCLDNVITIQLKDTVRQPLLPVVKQLVNDKTNILQLDEFEREPRIYNLQNI